MTVRFIADENFNRRIIVGLQRRTGSIDVVRVQDVGLRTADDPEVLRWAADEGRVLLTHDIATMPDFAYQRITAGQPMPGVFVVRATLALAAAIDELSLIAEVSDSDEWNGQVVYLPLR